jgi:hypothetical protein
MGRKHSTYGAEHSYLNGFPEETWRKMEDPSTDERTVLKQNIENYYRRVWLGFSQLLVAASQHNTHTIYQLLFMQRLMKISK